MKFNGFSLTAAALVSVARAGGEGGGDKCEPVTVYSTVKEWQDVEEKTVYLTSTYKEVKWQTDYVTVTDTVTDTVEVTKWSTDYVTITDTDVQVKPTTVVDTVTAVDTVTVSAVETQPEYYTETQVRTDFSTVTSTVFEEDTTTVTEEGPTITISDCPTTQSPTGLVLCTTRDVNPTYTPKKPLPTDYVWGCPPGKICTPPQIDCNFERGPPSENYVCAPDECKPTPEIPDYVNASAAFPGPTDADCAWYKPPPGFFNLDPEDFGLTYAIFDIYGQPVCETQSYDWSDSGWGDSKAPKGKPPRGRRTRRTNNPLANIMRRQSGGPIQYAPAPCYGVYNRAVIVGQHAGKRWSLLCADDSEFQIALDGCRSCRASAAPSASTSEYPALQSSQNWCNANPSPTA